MWFVGLIDLEQHTARDTQAIWAWKLISHPYIWLHSAQDKSGLTSCEDLAMALTNDTLNYILFNSCDINLQFSLKCAHITSILLMYLYCKLIVRDWISSYIYISFMLSESLTYMKYKTQPSFSKSLYQCTVSTSHYKF